MADDVIRDEEDQPSEEARQILRTFEQILEVMPHDRSTLEAAEQAAQQCGAEEKALTYRLRLVELMEQEGDEEGLVILSEILRLDRDPRARQWINSYDMRSRATQPQDAAQHAREPREAAVNISEEIDMAWKLFEAEVISQEDYSTLVRDLTELSSGKSKEMPSVLHALEATNHKNLESILAHLAQVSRLPYISLSCFTMRAELIPFLSENFIRRHGALVFEMLSRELMVAVLNPFSETLRQEVEQETQRPCHFYLTRASEFEGALRQLLESAD